MTDVYRLSIQEIAKNLELRRQTQTSTTLVLGSRAGGLFRSRALYTMLGNFTSRNLQALPRNEAFEECYRVFSTWSLSPTELHNTIRRALQDVSFAHEDEVLAGLMQQGYFSEIITTNIDDVLEEALRHIGLRAGRDFEVVYPGADPLYATPSRIKIVKVFGDFHSRDYAIKDRLKYLAVEKRAFFKSLLGKDMLMVGIDSMWDEKLLQVCPPLGDTLWYVSEELSYPPLVERLLRGRPASTFSGADGHYSQFFPELSAWMHSFGLARILYPEEATPATPSHEAADEQQAEQAETSEIVIEQEETMQLPGGIIYQKRTKIFVPYSRGDKKHLDRLHMHLNQNQVFNEVWDDTKILPGTVWREEIEKALQETRIAVPLVSADFFASNFIMNEELPPLLEAAQRGEVIIIPVIVSPCLFKESPLGQFQALNDPKDVLSSLSTTKRDQLWVQLAKRVKKIFDEDKH